MPVLPAANGSRSGGASSTRSASRDNAAVASLVPAAPCTMPVDDRGVMCGCHRRADPARAHGPRWVARQQALALLRRTPNLLPRVPDPRRRLAMRARTRALRALGLALLLPAIGGWNSDA